jgi:8-oxo-dGTP pyrophosphatase MutT (NUDIX family)
MSCQKCPNPTKGKHLLCGECHKDSRIPKYPPPFTEFIDQLGSESKLFAVRVLRVIYNKLVELWDDDDFKRAVTYANSGTVVAIVDGEALMVLEKNSKQNKLFGFPGGSRLSKKEHPLVTALREWVEETKIPIFQISGVDFIYHKKSAGYDLICLMYVDHLDIEICSNFQTLLPLRMIQYCKERDAVKQSVWFDIYDGQLVPNIDDKNPNKFRIRQCTYHKFESILEYANQHAIKN